MRLLALAAMLAGSVLVAVLVWASVAQQATELYGFLGWWGIAVMLTPGTVIAAIAYLSG